MGCWKRENKGRERIRMGQGDVPTISFSTIYNLNHHLEGQRSFIGVYFERGRGRERERERERGMFHHVDSALFMPSIIILNLR